MIADNAPQPHHTENGFQNLNPSAKSQGLGMVLYWKLGNFFKSLPSVEPSDYKIETTLNKGELLQKNSKNLSVTWIGHATVLIQLDGQNILTDPIWSERCSPVSFAGPKRYTAPGISMDHLPPIHIVIISHNHYDHLDLPTLKELETRFKPTFFVGLKNGKLLKEEGIQNVIEMDWWNVKLERDIKITFTPTQHFSGRGLFDREETLWGSYILEGSKETVYFAGDTGYFPQFKEIGKKFPNIDIAILPIGAYEPRWFMKPIHMNPEDSYQAFLDLNAKYLLPMHYNTFVLTDEALDEPLVKTKSFFEANRNKLLDLKIGESKFF